MEVSSKAQRSHLPTNVTKSRKRRPSITDQSQVDIDEAPAELQRSTSNSPSRQSSKEKPGFVRRTSKERNSMDARKGGMERKETKTAVETDETSQEVDRMKKDANKMRRLWDDKEFVMKQLKLDGWNLGHANVKDEFRADRELVMEAVSCNGAALTYASEELKNDREVVLNAILSNAWSLADASESLKNDKKLVMQAVRLDGLTLAHASPQLRRDADVVLEAIAQDGNAMRNAQENLLESKAFVMEAVELNWTSFKVAPASLQADSEFLLECMDETGYHQILQWASERLRGDVQFMEVVLEHFGQALQFASRAIRENKKLVTLAVQQDPHSLVHASKALRNDPDVVFEAVSKDGLALAHASRALQADRNVVIAAVSQNRKATEYVSQAALLRDPELVAVFSSQATPDLSRAGTPMPGESSSRPVSRQSNRECMLTPEECSSSEEEDESSCRDVLSSVLHALKENRQRHGLPAFRSFDPAEHGNAVPAFGHVNKGPIVTESVESMKARWQNSGRTADEMQSANPGEQDEQEPEILEPEIPETPENGDSVQDEGVDKVVASYNTSWQADS